MGRHLSRHRASSRTTRDPEDARLRVVSTVRSLGSISAGPAHRRNDGADSIPACAASRRRPGRQIITETLERRFDELSLERLERALARAIERVVQRRGLERRQSRRSVQRHVPDPVAHEEMAIFEDLLSGDLGPFHAGRDQLSNDSPDATGASPHLLHRRALVESEVAVSREHAWRQNERTKQRVRVHAGFHEVTRGPVVSSCAFRRSASCHATSASTSSPMSPSMMRSSL